MYNRTFIEQCSAFFSERSLEKQDQGLNFISNASSTHTRVTELKVEQINFTGQWHFDRKYIYI